MSRPFIISDLDPNALAPLVRAARQERKWSVAELARLAFVEAATVSRVEDPDQDAGALTALNIAETAKVFDFEQGQNTDPVVCELVELLFSREDAAARIFERVVEQHICEGVSRSVSCDLLGIYNAGAERLRLQVIEPVSVLGMMVRNSDVLQNVLPKDLGSAAKECLKFMPKGSQRSDYMSFWNQLAAGRSSNISSGRLVQAVSDMTQIIDEFVEERKIKGISSVDFMALAAAAFRNHLTIDRIYKDAQRYQGPKDFPDFWRLIHDVMKMVRTTRHTKKARR